MPISGTSPAFRKSVHRSVLLVFDHPVYGFLVGSLCQRACYHQSEVGCVWRSRNHRARGLRMALGFIDSRSSPIYLFLMTYPTVTLSDVTFSRLRRVGNMILVLLMAYFTIWALQFIGGWLTAWIADHDPCAAWHAGVTGSIPPT